MTHKQKKRIGNVTFYIIATILALVVAMPFFWMLSTSFKSGGALMSIPVQWIPKKPTLAAYEKLFGLTNFWRSIGNSFYLAILSTAIQVVSSGMAAFALSKIHFKGRGAMFSAYLATMMIPFQVIFIPIFLVMSRLGITNNLTALAVTHLFMPMAIFMYRQTMLMINDSFIEAAVIDGANSFQVFFHVIYPLCKGTTATVFIMGFMASWNDYLLPLVLLSDQKKYTLQLILNSLEGQFGGQYNLMMAGSLVSIIPILVIYIFLQKYFKSGMQLGGVKG